MAAGCKPYRRPEGDPPPTYSDGSDFFSCEIHHGGYICGTDLKMYVDDKVCWYDFCETDTWSLLWICDFAKKLGYTDDDKVKAYWLIPGKTMSTGLKHVKGDRDCNCMTSFVPRHRNLVIYLDEIGVLEGIDWDEDLLSPAASQLNTQLLPKLHTNPSVVSSPSPKRSQRMENDATDVAGNRTIKVHMLDVDDDNEAEDGAAIDSDFVDSDYEIDREDDDLFEEEVDTTVDEEFAGLVQEVQNSENDYVPSDEEELHPSESDEGNPNVMKSFPSFRTARDMKNPPFHVGLKFASMDELRGAVRDHSISYRCSLEFVKNDRDRVKVKCQEGCNWYLFASEDARANLGIVIKEYEGKHSCYKKWKNKWLTGKYIKKNKYLETFRAMPKLNIRELRRLISKDFNLVVSKTKLYRARWHALKLIYGDELAQYAQLWDYGAEIKRSNPGSTFYLQLNGDLNPLNDPACFHKLYFSFDACKRGFMLGCRPLIFLDGTHIKTKYEGQLLAAVAMDPNECIFPLAMAVVEVEDKKSWKWFLETLKKDLGITNTAPWTIMTDKQKGIVQALNDEFGDCEQRFCVRHLYQNFNVLFKGEELKKQVWACARSSTVHYWQQNMEKLKEMDKDAYEWLEAMPPHQWCRAFFREFPLCDVLLNNNCEVFNKWILEVRSEPILTMMESIRGQLMNRFYSKGKEAAEKWTGKLCPKIAAKLEKNCELAIICTAVPSEDGLFEVTKIDRTYTVNITTGQCDCRRWQLTGIPCSHGIACMRGADKDPVDYVHHCHYVSTYLRAYGESIKPVRDKTMWEKTNGIKVLPPVYLRKAGRKKRCRKKQPYEKPNKKLSKHGGTMHCSHCRSANHTKRTCEYLKAGVDQAKAREMAATFVVSEVQHEAEPILTQELSGLMYNLENRNSYGLPSCAFIDANVREPEPSSTTEPVPESDFIASQRERSEPTPRTTATKAGKKAMTKRSKKGPAKKAKKA